MKILTKIFVLSTLLTILLLSGCRKERKAIGWNIDALAPLIYGELSIKDLLKDSLVSTNTDNSVQLSFYTNLYKLNFDSLLNIPDTTIKNNYTIPFSAGITVSPGQTFIAEPENITLNIDDVELTKAKIKKGKINYILSSNINAEIIYEYTISNAINTQGLPFIKQLTVPAAGGSNSFVSGSFDLTGYTISLTGTNNNDYNTLSTLVKMKLSENHPVDLLISNMDTVKLENKVSNISIDYAEGYFGNQKLSQSSSNEISQMKNIINGSIDIEQVAVKLEIINGIGADAAFTIQNLISKSTNNSIALTHQLIGDENFINRASQSGGSISSTEFTSSFTSANSNIENWLENLPDSILYDLDFELNTLGNVSGHHDFIDAKVPFEVNMNVDMPLSFIASNLILTDTITLNTENIEQVIKGKLKLSIDNGFPLEATLSLKNELSNEELFSPTPVLSALIDNNGVVSQTVKSTHEITFSEEALNQLKVNNKLILQIKFNSPASSNLISIYDYYKLKFSVVSDFTYQTNIE